MFFAFDLDGKRVFIDEAESGKEYFCPQCGGRLVIKKDGLVRIHHFAHKNSGCSDSWHYDMSEWHQRWQSRFPAENQEITKTYNGQKHRADVLIESHKVVFEFQHSPLSAEEFHDRNCFYQSLGYKVIWVFDVSGQYNNGYIDNYKGDLYKWSYPMGTINGFVPKENPGIELYFQIQNAADENLRIILLREKLEKGIELQKDEEDYFEEYKNDNEYLIKITWAPQQGFSRFATDGCGYDANDLVERFFPSPKTVNNCVRVDGLCDCLIESHRKDHTIYYSGCPISSTHLCGNWDLDISESEYTRIRPCNRCDYSMEEEGTLFCRKRFADLQLPPETMVEVTKKDDYGFVTELMYIDEKGKHVLSLQTFHASQFKSIFELWKEYNCKVAIFKNLRTGYFVKIGRDPEKQYKQYGKVYGYFSKHQYSFGKVSAELYGCDKPEWICVWNV